MTLPIPTAKAILRQRLGTPVKDVKYVYGFRTANGRILALHPEQKETRLWHQPPEAPSLPGVRRIPPAKNDDLNGPMAPLAGSQIPRVEIADGDALHRFLDWYAGSVAAPRAPRLRPALIRAPSLRRSHASRGSSTRGPVILSRALTKGSPLSGRATSRASESMHSACFVPANGQRARSVRV